MISKDLYPKIEEMAEQLVPPSQMAAVLDVNEDELILALSRHNSECRKIYLRGIYKAAQEIRVANLGLAKAGSPDAIRSCISSMQEMLNELNS